MTRNEKNMAVATTLALYGIFGILGGITSEQLIGLDVILGKEIRIIP